MPDETRQTDRNHLLAAFHEDGRLLLMAQTRALDAIIHDLLQLDKDQDRPEIRVPLLMLQAVGVSIHSILLLTQERSMAIRDGFGITRSAVETAINAAYISTTGVAQAERSLRYMHQKRWRDLNREGTVGDLKITTSRDIGRTVNEFPGLEEALAEFTDRKGRERRTWTDISIEDRISEITKLDRRAGIAFGSAIFGIYRPASELLHGSYYGVNHFWQGSRSEPARTQEAFNELWVTEHFVTLLSCLFFAVSGAIGTIIAVHRLPFHAERQDHLAVELGRMVETLRDSDPAPDTEHAFTAKEKP